MQQDNSNTNHDAAISMVLDDKLDSSRVSLLSEQQRYLKPLKDNNEEQRQTTTSD